MTFSPLTQEDRDGFAGATANAVMAEGPICNEQCVVVADDGRIEVFSGEGRYWSMALPGMDARHCACVAKGLFQALADSPLELPFTMDRFGFIDSGHN